LGSTMIDPNPQQLGPNHEKVHSWVCLVLKLFLFSTSQRPSSPSVFLPDDLRDLEV